MRPIIDRLIIRILKVLVSIIPRRLLLHRNLRFIKIHMYSKRKTRASSLTIPNGISLSPRAVILPVMFSIFEIEALDDSLEYFLNTCGRAFSKQQKSRIRKWIQDCLIRQGESRMFFSLDFSDLPEIVRPTLFTETECYLSQSSESFITLLFHINLSAFYLSEFKKLHNSLPWEFRLVGHLFKDDLSQSVLTSNMLRLKERNKLLRRVIKETSAILCYFGLPCSEDKFLTRVEVFRMSSNDKPMGELGSNLKEEIRNLFNQDLVAYLCSIGVLRGLPDYVGEGISLAQLSTGYESTTRSYSVILNEPDIDEEDPPPLGRVSDSLMQWASVRAFVDFAFYQRNIANKSRWALTKAVAPGNCTRKQIRRIPLYLENARRAKLLLEILKKELPNLSSIPLLMNDPIRSLRSVYSKENRTLENDVYDWIQMFLNHPICEKLSAAEEVAMQYLNIRILMSNSKVQKSLVCLSVILALLTLALLLPDSIRTDLYKWLCNMI